MEPQEVISENALAIAENETGQFGPGADKNYNAADGVFEFFAGEGENAWMPLNTLPDEYGDGREAGSPQTILIKFKPADRLMFDFMGPNEFGIDFWEENKPSLFWFIEAYKEPFEGELALQADAWYYTLMAIDSEGNFRSIVWEDGNANNRATYGGNFAERDNGGGYINQPWKFIIGFQGASTLSVEEYRIFTFNGFAQ
ncbi:MAG: hypothetical protein JXA13_05370 [Anaerolineales bacterium]|nr:hypothetical protein [Anaerolineales bacterium]